MMDSIDFFGLCVAFAVGIVLGVFYFGGLWLTVRQIPNARRPGLLSLSSFVIRITVTLLGLYMVMGGRWQRILVAVLGLLLVRCLAVRRWGPGRAFTDAQDNKGDRLANQS